MGHEDVVDSYLQTCGQQFAAVLQKKIRIVVSIIRWTTSGQWLWNFEGLTSTCKPHGPSEIIIPPSPLFHALTNTSMATNWFCSELMSISLNYCRPIPLQTSQYLQYVPLQNVYICILPNQCFYWKTLIKHICFMNMMLNFIFLRVARRHIRKFFQNENANRYIVV